MYRITLFFVLVFTFFSKVNCEVIARIVKMEGRVFFKELGSDSFSIQVKSGASIKNGDQIKVSENSFAAIIYLDDRSILKVRENTSFIFMDTRNTRTIDISHGTVLSQIKKEGRNKNYRVQTPVSVASVKGTEFAAIVSQNGVDQFICKEGLFEVLNMVSGETVQVATGQKAISNGTGSIMQSPASPSEYPLDPEVEKELIEESLKNFEDLLDSNIPEDNLDLPQNNEELPKDSGEIETNSEEKKPDGIDEVNEQQVIEESEELTSNEALPQSTKSSPKLFSMGLGIGSATIDEILYNQIALRPEINIGKLGIGLDLVLYVDNEGNIRDEEWDIENDPSLLLDKILYIRYGGKNDKVWGKYGSIEALTLGYGGLMNNYSNMMEYPTVRRVGFNTGFNFGPIGGELFLSNLKDFSRGGTVTGLRMAYTISDNIPLSIGVNYITDLNMFSALKDKDEDSFPDVFDDFPDDSTLWNDTDGDGFPDPGQGNSVPDSLIDIDSDGDNILDELDGEILLKAKPFSLKDNSAQTTAFSLDIGYPILQSKSLSLILFAEYNILNFPGVISVDSSFVRPERSGVGITVPGLRSIIFNILSLSIEYRLINGAYVPQYFDQAYDLNRVVTSSFENSTIVRTKDMVVFESYNDSSNSSGIYGSAGFNLFDLINFSASYANMKSDTTELISFASYLNLNTDNIPKISTAMAYFQRNNDIDPFDFENPSANTVMGYRIGYELSKGVSLIWDYRQFYRDDGTGKLKPIQQTNIETTFNF